MGIYYVSGIPYSSDELYHHGIKGQKWGVRRYQNEDGTLTSIGRKRYGYLESQDKAVKNVLKEHKQDTKAYNKEVKRFTKDRKAYDEYSKKYAKEYYDMDDDGSASYKKEIKRMKKDNKGAISYNYMKENKSDLYNKQQQSYEKLTKERSDLAKKIMNKIDMNAVPDKVKNSQSRLKGKNAFDKLQDVQSGTKRYYESQKGQALDKGNYRQYKEIQKEKKNAMR